MTRTFAGNNATNVGTVSGVISNSSATAVGPTINGSGVVAFSGTNTYTGTTTLTAGTLQIGADANLGADGATVTFNGGTLRVTGAAVTSFANHPAVLVAGKPLALDIATAGTTFTVSQSLAAGQILTKAGAGTLALSAASNTVANLNMNGGTLDIGTGTLNISNAGTTTIRGTANSTINATGGGSIVLSMNGTTGTDFADNSVSNGVTLTINAKVSGATAITGFEYCCDNPGGTIVLANPANDFGGNVFMNSAGTIQVPAIGLAGAASPLGKGNTITLAGLTGTQGARLLYTGPGETTDRVIALGQTQNILDSSGGTAATPLKFTSNISVTNTAAKTFTLQGTGFGEIAGVIPNNTAATSIVKTGTGTWTLSAPTRSPGPSLSAKARSASPPSPTAGPPARWARGRGPSRSPASSTTPARRRPPTGPSRPPVAR